MNLCACVLICVCVCAVCIIVYMYGCIRVYTSMHCVHVCAHTCFSQQWAEEPLAEQLPVTNSSGQSASALLTQLQAHPSLQRLHVHSMGDTSTKS